MIKVWKRVSFTVAILGLLPFAGYTVVVLILITLRNTLLKRTSRQVTFLRRVSAVFGILTVLQGISNHRETVGRLVGACHQGPS